MRIVSADGREVIATSDELKSASALPEATLRDAQHINLAVEHSVTQFNALTSLQGLHVATQLRNLNVSHNAIMSLHGVEAFENLRLLRCSGNCISDLSWLAALPNLRELWVNDNQIETPQIAHLASLRTLETLVLHPNPCTNAVNYVSYVVKTVPWLSRVDLVVVDGTLRQQSQHIDERAFLSSAATDVSEISLMTSRSDDAEPEDPGHDGGGEELREPGLPALSKATAENMASSTVDKTSAPNVEVRESKKKTKKMTAEDIMRSFPVQDFIPATSEGLTSQAESREPCSAGLFPIDPAKLLNQQVVGMDHESNQDYHDTDQPKASVLETILPPESPETLKHSTTSLSAIASAVQSLPLFGNDSVHQKSKKTTGGAAPKQNKITKKAAPSKSATIPNPDAELASFHQPQLVTTYPNSSVNAVYVRADGTALAKWPGGSVAVSVDRERDGFRCYAAHKDGTIALSVDAGGVGFINYYPSGRMMISTSSSGDGLFFSSEGAILRQWDAQLNMKNDKWEPTDKLSDAEPDGTLVVKLSDGLGVRLQLKPTGMHADGSQSSSAIALTVFFNSGTGIRHAFCNWINKSESTASECAVVFGKDAPKHKKKASDSHTHTHFDTLHDIRAAVAKLS